MSGSYAKDNKCVYWHRWEDVWLLGMLSPSRYYHHARLALSPLPTTISSAQINCDLQLLAARLSRRIFGIRHADKNAEWWMREVPLTVIDTTAMIFQFLPRRSARLRRFWRFHFLPISSPFLIPPFLYISLHFYSTHFFDLSHTFSRGAYNISVFVRRHGFRCHLLLTIFTFYHFSCGIKDASNVRNVEWLSIWRRTKDLINFPIATRM